MASHKTAVETQGTSGAAAVPPAVQEAAREVRAGRELDALVAEKVLGWRRYEQMDTSFDLWTDGFCEERGLARFSTDIAAAWMVVGKIGGWFHLACFESTGEWRASFDSADADGFAEGETAPLAICRAALAVMECGA